MAYPSPSEVNVSKGLPEIIKYTNSVTMDWFVNMLLISIAVIIMIQYYRTTGEFMDAFAVASFATFVIATLFFIGQILSPFTYMYVIAFALLGGFALFMRKR